MSTVSPRPSAPLYLLDVLIHPRPRFGVMAKDGRASAMVRNVLAHGCFDVKADSEGSRA